MDILAQITNLLDNWQGTQIPAPRSEYMQGWQEGQSAMATAIRSLVENEYRKAELSLPVERTPEQEEAKAMDPRSMA